MDEVIKFLEFIGIRGYENKAYLTLLTLGEATASQIASKARIPLTRIYEVLESLVNKGLIEVQAGRPRVYRAIPPRIALTHYVRMYVNELLNSSKRIIDELSRFYRTAKEEKISIWISSSFSMSVERTKEMISNMKVDGFASINEELFAKLSSTIYSKLLKNGDSIFTLTITSELYDQRDLEPLLSLDNIDLRSFPTGVINVVEVDLSKAVVFGKAYTLFTTEWELIMIINESFYHGSWKTAQRIKRFNVKSKKRYKTTHHWLAVELISDGLKEGYNAKAYVKGFYVRSKEPIEVEGYVRRVNVSNFIRNFSLQLREGNEVVIGGLGASIEDIEARYIEVEFT